MSSIVGAGHSPLNSLVWLSETVYLAVSFDMIFIDVSKHR